MFLLLLSFLVFRVIFYTIKVVNLQPYIVGNMQPLQNSALTHRLFTSWLFYSISYFARGGGYSTEGLTGTCRWKFKNGSFVGLKFLEITYSTWDFLSKRYPENLKKGTLHGTVFKRETLKTWKRYPTWDFLKKSGEWEKIPEWDYKPKNGTLSSGTSPYQVLGSTPSPSPGF